MKKILTIMVLLSAIIFAQEVQEKKKDSVAVYQSGWFIGGGISYPRYMAISNPNVSANDNSGAYLTLGYNITEHFGFRLTPHYVRLNSFYYASDGTEIDNFVNMSSLNLEAVYSVLPCERIMPYLMLGYGVTNFKSQNPYPSTTGPILTESYWGYQFLLGIGAEFKFWEDVSLRAEFDYITASNNKIDGNFSVNENKGLLWSNGDSYMNLKVGAIWYFSRGEKSKICSPPAPGIREVIKEVTIEKVDTVYVDKIVEKAVIEHESFVLENVRFKFDKDELTPEAQSILTNVAKTLNRYPDQLFEILGHTDNIGSDEYNMDLSERRAKSVKNYLVSQGVSADRLFTAGCGERKPVADNSTEVGRSINRRIEFSIYDGVSSKCPEGGILQNGDEFENAVKNSEQVKIEGIFFKFDKDELTPESELTLDHVVNVLKKYPDANVEIEGHTDNMGDEKYNQLLSENRAKSVKNYLVSKGITASRLTTIGYGEAKPIEDNTTEYGRAVNRRIEFKITNESNIKIKDARPDVNGSMLDQDSSPEEQNIADAISKGEKLVFTNINFFVDSDNITDPSKKILDNVSNVLKKMSDVNVEIQGHTDSDGPEEYNQGLSEKRAISVKNYLVKSGISIDRLTTKGFGESKPITENTTKEGKAKNRRIEFEVIK